MIVERRPQEEQGRDCNGCEGVGEEVEGEEGEDEDNNDDNNDAVVDNGDEGRSNDDAVVVVVVVVDVDEGRRRFDEDLEINLIDDSVLCISADDLERATDTARERMASRSSSVNDDRVEAAIIRSSCRRIKFN